MLTTALVCIGLFTPIQNQTNNSLTHTKVFAGTTPPPSGVPYTPIKKKDLKPVLTTPKKIVVTAKDLVKAIEALEYKGLKLKLKYKLKVAKAALKVGTELKIDPYLIIALSRMESDFLSSSEYSNNCYIRGRRCQADCGITQHNFTGTRRYVFNRCKKLKRFPAIAMRLSAKELRRHVTYCDAKIKKCKISKAFRCKKSVTRCATVKNKERCLKRANRDCKWRKRTKCYDEPRMRCILNRYNQGTFYKRSERCKSRKRDWWISKKAYKRVRGRCLHLAAYWTKTMCFYYGAKNQKKLKRSCRRCYSTKSIPRFYRLRNVKYTLPKLASIFF